MNNGNNRFNRKGLKSYWPTECIVIDKVKCPRPVREAVLKINLQSIHSTRDFATKSTRQLPRPVTSQYIVAAWISCRPLTAVLWSTNNFTFIIFVVYLTRNENNKICSMLMLHFSHVRLQDISPNGENMATKK